MADGLTPRVTSTEPELGVRTMLIPTRGPVGNFSLLQFVLQGLKFHPKFANQGVCLYVETRVTARRAARGPFKSIVHEGDFAPVDVCRSMNVLRPALAIHHHSKSLA